MNELIENLAKALRATDGGIKIIAGLVGLAIVVGVGFALHLAQDTQLDYAVFYNLNSREATNAGKALSDAGIEFHASSPPGPYTIRVDEENASQAMAAAYAANALDKPLKGYQKEDGANIFLSSGEREANLEKAAWQEAERMLETFGFVESASVMVPKAGARPMFDRKQVSRAAAVTLVLSGSGVITDEQAGSVTQIAMSALGVASRDLTIADQNGNFIFNGAEDSKAGLVDKQLLKVQRDHDRTKTEELNEYLSGIYGPNMASVRISSDWNWEKSAEQETRASEGATVEDSSTQSSRGTAQQSVGGPAGMTSNAQTGDYGIGTSATAAAAGGGPQSESTDKNKRFIPTITKTSTVNDQPEIARLSIVAVVAESVVATDGTRDEAKVTALQLMIQTAAGFNETTRTDVFNLSFTDGFYAPEVVVDENAEPASEPSTLLPMLLRRGVEIVTALAFVFFLLKTLKSSKGEANKEIVAAKAGKAEDAVDPEALARAQIADLLETDPERVGTILADWARERPTVNS